MNKITLAQREALDVVKDMIDKSNTNVPDYGTKIITLILGILNIDCRVEHTFTQIDGDKITPIINPNDGAGNDKLQLTIPDWIKEQQTPPFIPGDRTSEPAPWEPRVWYNQETEPKQPAAQELRYATSVSCTENKNCITTARDVSDCTTYTGDFRDVQTSFNAK